MLTAVTRKRRNHKIIMVTEIFPWIFISGTVLPAAILFGRNVTNPKKTIDADPIRVAQKGTLSMAK